MSAKVMGQVFDYETSPTEQAVLLALADHADHNGENVRPSVELLAWKTGMSERGVQGILSRLRDRGVLVVAKLARHHRATEYRIVLGALTAKAPLVRGARPAPQRDEAAAPQDTASRGAADDTRGARRAVRGAAKGAPGVQQLVHPNRHIEPSTESSENLPRAARATGSEIPLRIATQAEIERELKLFGKAAEKAWLAAAKRTGSIYTDRSALRIVNEHAILALSFGTETQVLAAIAARATRETTMRRIEEITRLYVGDETQRLAIERNRTLVGNEIIEGPRHGTLRHIGDTARALVAAAAS